MAGGEGGVYYSSNITGRAQVFRQSEPGGTADRLVENENRVVPHAQTPLGLLVLEDHEGDEIWQLGLIAGDLHRQLTILDFLATHVL